MVVFYDIRSWMGDAIQCGFWLVLRLRCAVGSVAWPRIGPQFERSTKTLIHYTRDVNTLYVVLILNNCPGNVSEQP